MTAYSAVAASGRVPFRGSDRGYFVASQTPDPLVLVTQGFSSGHAVGLGRYGLVTQQRVNLDTLAVAEGSFTLTIVGGDILAGEHEGRAWFADEPGVIVYETAGRITAGTGRFAGAAGVVTFEGRADLAAGDVSETVSGWLASPE